MDLLIVDAHLCHCRPRPGSWSPASWRTAPRPTQPRTRTCHATSPLSVTQCAEVLLTATRSPRRRPGPGHTPRVPHSSRRSRPGRTVARSNPAGTRRCHCYSGRVANTDLRTASNYCRSSIKRSIIPNIPACVSSPAWLAHTSSRLTRAVVTTRERAHADVAAWAGPVRGASG